MSPQSPSIFENGAAWLRADFHLHTIKDKEFKYDDNPNDFIKSCISRLKEESINLAVITNHNKFDRDEYTNLKKKAAKEEIWILPGVELSVNDGANGIHCLIVFDPDGWFPDGEDCINHFLTSAFNGITNRENANQRCNYSLNQLLEILQKSKVERRDSFIIMAHVNQNNGFLAELEGGRIEQFAQNPLFGNFVLGFQKFRDFGKLPALKQYFNDKLPAFVEGSDPKNINEVGKAHIQSGSPKTTFIKLGAFNFDALKYALIDHPNRLSSQIPEVNNAWLKSITFVSQKQHNQKLPFNSSMNNLIGIRGSGKSSILETIRYALDIPLGKNSHEPEYKENLVRHFLGSGGKLILELVDSRGKIYRAEKILGESTVIYHNDELCPNLKINAVINKPLYYGQKDLSDIGGETSTEDLVSKLVGDKLNENNKLIQDKVHEITLTLAEYAKLDKHLKSKPEIEARIAALENNIKIFTEHEVDKKLKKQVEFNKDENQLNSLINFAGNVIKAVKDLFNEYNGDFDSFRNYKSVENEILYERVYFSFQNFQNAFLKLKSLLADMEKENTSLNTLRDELKRQYTKLVEEFSEIKRSINVPNLDADAFIKFSRDLDIQSAKLTELNKINARKTVLNNKIKQLLTELKTLWHNGFTIVNNEISKINQYQPKLQIISEFKGNKAEFKKYLKSALHGSGIRDTVYTGITEDYADLIEVYDDLVNTGTLKSQFTAGYSAFQMKFYDNLASFLTYRVPDKYTIMYNGRPLSQHSLGQRASALILFILTLKENDLIIIDQPEDDLDNQTIYSEVIKELRALKNSTQFIFATHNPNIPVLGDCEQNIVCKFNDGTIETELGSIDAPVIQEKIVEIMEGGKEAFNNRKRIYELWNH